MVKPLAPKAPIKPPHPARLNALDLARLNEANALVAGCRLELECKMLQARVRELEHNEAIRLLRNDAAAAQSRAAAAEGNYQELAARLAKDYGVNLKTCAVMPETGEFTTFAPEAKP